MYVYTIETNAGTVGLVSSRQEAYGMAMQILEEYTAGTDLLPVVRGTSTPVIATADVLNRQILDHKEVYADIASMDYDKFVAIKRWKVIQRKRVPSELTEE